MACRVWLMQDSDVIYLSLKFVINVTIIMYSAVNAQCHAKQCHVHVRLVHCAAVCLNIAIIANKLN
jgi:hypothetical protein